MIFHRHIGEELKETDIEVGYTIPIIAGILSMTGSFFFGFAFSDLSAYNWMVVPSAAAMVVGFALGLHNIVTTGKAIQQTVRTILRVSEEVQDTQEKVFGTKGEFNSSWSNAIYDRIAELERKVDKLKQDIRTRQPLY